MLSVRTKLRGWCERCDAIAQMAEVLWTNLKAENLFNHRQEVGQRADDPERWSIGGSRQTPRDGQSQGVLNRFERHAALVQLGREQTVGPTDGAAGARCRTVGLQKSADIIALLHEFSFEVRAATGR